MGPTAEFFMTLNKKQHLGHLGLVENRQALKTQRFILWWSNIVFFKLPYKWWFNEKIIYCDGGLLAQGISISPTKLPSSHIFSRDKAPEFFNLWDLVLGCSWCWLNRSLKLCPLMSPKPIPVVRGLQMYHKHILYDTNDTLWYSHYIPVSFA